MHFPKAITISLLAAVSLNTYAESNTDVGPGPLNVSSSKIVKYLSNHGISVTSAYQTEAEKKLGLKVLLTNHGIVRVNEKESILIPESDILSIDDNGVLNGSNAAVIKNYLDTVPYKIIAKAPDEKAVIQVFTDVTCPHCQNFHQHLNDYLSKGITVEFMLFARFGYERPEFLQMSAIQSQPDQLKALTKEMSGIPISSPTKPSVQMAMHQQAAMSIGVHSTPSIFYKGFQIPNTKEGAPFVEKALSEINKDIVNKDLNANRVEF